MLAIKKLKFNLFFSDVVTNSSSEILLYYEDSYIIDKNRNKI